MRLDGDAEAIEVGRGLGGLDTFVERPAVGVARMLDEDDAIFVAGVVGGVGDGCDVHVVLDDKALVDLQVVESAARSSGR